MGRPSRRTVSVHRAVEISLEHPRMNVRLAAHRAGVAQQTGHSVDGEHDVAVSLRSGLRRRNGAQRTRGEHGRPPGPEVLGRDVFSRDLPQIAIYVGGAHVAANTVVVEVLKQVLTRQVAALSHDPYETWMADVHTMMLAALPTEVELQTLLPNSHMAVTHRCEAEGPVGLRVFVVADADEAFLEQLHHRGEYLFAREPPMRQCRGGARPDSREDRREQVNMLELGVVAVRAPRIVIAVLLPAACIASGRLQVAAGIGTDPDVGPCGRNYERADTRQGRAVTDSMAVSVDVSKLLSVHVSPDPRAVVACISQAR